MVNLQENKPNGAIIVNAKTKKPVNFKYYDIIEALDPNQLIF